MLSEKIKSELAKKGLNVVDVANKSKRYKNGKFTYKSLYRWIKGDRKPNLVSLRTLEKILKVKKGTFIDLILK